MPTLDQLHTTIEKEVGAFRRNLVARKSSLRAEMVRYEEGEHRFWELADRWAAEIVIPRIKEARTHFPESEEPDYDAESRSARWKLRSTAEFVTGAELMVKMTYDTPKRRGRIMVSMRILPILIPAEPDAAFEVDVNGPRAEAFGAFFDEQLLRFVRYYLRANAPDSPYQRYFGTTDPVCKMAFSRSAAAATVRYDGATYYFCADGCRAKFEADPELYLGRKGDAPRR